MGENTVRTTPPPKPKVLDHGEHLLSVVLPFLFVVLFVGQGCVGMKLQAACSAPRTYSRLNAIRATN